MSHRDQHLEFDSTELVSVPQELQQLADLTRRGLALIGEDPEREGLLRTPERVARAWEFLSSGYRQDLSTVVNGALFEAEGSEMVVVKDIEFYSLCEHHLLPFFGKVHIGYVPGEQILGISKFARIVEMYARRLQVQERMATEIAGALERVLQPQGVGVVVEGVHLCMMMRGVAKQHSSTTTSAMFGVFREDSRTRQEFLGLIR